MADNACLTLDEIHEEEVRLLLKFDAFCRDHGLRYSLCGGTLLGAVRHKGFIPWDDDIDLNMPRPDWDRLVSMRDAFKADTGLEIVPADGALIDSAPFVKVVNPRIAVQPEAELSPSLLWIDVIPLDGLPAKEEDVRRIYGSALRIRKTFAVAVTTAASGHSGPRRLFKRITGPILRAFKLQRVFSARLDDLARNIPYGSTGYVGAISWGMYGAGERMPLKEYESTVSLEFEGHEFSSMSCWDQYLSGIYGDYMKLPPEGERVNHGMKAWRIDQ